MNITRSAITSLKDYRIKKFEKKIRRFLVGFSNSACIVNGVYYNSQVFNAYLFKSMLDNMHEENIVDNPIDAIISYSHAFTLTDLKSDSLVVISSDENKERLNLIDNYDAFVIHVYDDKSYLDPKEPYCRIFFALNKNKKEIIPIKFTRDLSLDFPKWFVGKLERRDNIKNGIDMDLMQRIKSALD